MGTTTTKEREIEREYRLKRQAIIASTSMSWEKKMLAIKGLFQEYRRKLEKGD